MNPSSVDAGSQSLSFAIFAALVSVTLLLCIMTSAERDDLDEFYTGFRTLAHDFVFGPLAPLIGPRGAAAVTFLASGVVHDLVISLPARASYGLPTLYFLLQFAGLSLERTPRFRRLIARRPFIGRGWTVLVTAAPMPLLLFHGPFIRNVAVPFLKTIGGLS